MIEQGQSYIRNCANDLVPIMSTSGLGTKKKHEKTVTYSETLRSRPHQLIQMRKQFQRIINKEKVTCQIIDLVMLLNNRMQQKESKSLEKIPGSHLGAMKNVEEKSQVNISSHTRNNDKCYENQSWMNQEFIEDIVRVQENIDEGAGVLRRLVVTHPPVIKENVYILRIIKEKKKRKQVI